MQVRMIRKLFSIVLCFVVSKSSARHEWVRGKFGDVSFAFHPSRRVPFIHLDEDQHETLAIWLGRDAPTVIVHGRPFPMPTIWKDVVNVLYVFHEARLSCANVLNFLQEWFDEKPGSAMRELKIIIGGNADDRAFQDRDLVHCVGRSLVSKMELKIGGLMIGGGGSDQLPVTGLFYRPSSLETGNYDTKYKFERASLPVSCNAKLKRVVLVMDDVVLSYDHIKNDSSDTNNYRLTMVSSTLHLEKGCLAPEVFEAGFVNEKGSLFQKLLARENTNLLSCNLIAEQKEERTYNHDDSFPTLYFALLDNSFDVLCNFYIGIGFEAQYLFWEGHHQPALLHDFWVIGEDLVGKFSTVAHSNESPSNRESLVANRHLSTNTVQSWLQLNQPTLTKFSSLYILHHFFGRPT